MTSKIKNLTFPKKAEYLVPTLASLSFIFSCIIISSKKFFWNDELFSYYFLADPSFISMVEAFHDKLNNTPPLYFIMGWMWARVFSASELSLRLFSSLGFCLAFWITWLTLRRVYGFWSASIATLTIFCTSNIILYQNAEARMYGLYMTIAALTLLQFDLNNREKKCSRWSLICNFLIQAALVQTHLHGLFFGAAVLGAQIVRDLYFKLFRPQLYASFILGWLTLVFYIPAFLVQSDAGNPRSWLAVPSMGDLFSFISLLPSSYFRFTLLLFLVLTGGLQFFYGSGDRANPVNPQQRDRHPSEKKSFLIFAFSFLIVPVVVWLLSRLAKPIFFDRYLLPTLLAWAILISYFLSNSLSSYFSEAHYQKKIKLFNLSLAPLQIGLSILLFIMMTYPIYNARSYEGNFLSGVDDNRYGYATLPIATQASSKFLERFYNTPEHRYRYFFILDRQAAESPAAGLFALQEYKHHDAFRRNYPEIFKDNIIESEAFLKKNPKFLVLDYPNYNKVCPWKVIGIGNLSSSWTAMHCPQWLEMRLLHNPKYKITLLGPVHEQYKTTPDGSVAEYKGDEVLLLVETQLEANLPSNSQ